MYFDSDLIHREWVPAVNVKENEKDYEIELAAPGLTKEDFHISVNDGMMTIYSEKETETQEEEDRYTRREFSYASFRRTFRLPAEVDENKIRAIYRDGVLHIHIAKRNTGKKVDAKAIEVK